MTSSTFNFAMEDTSLTSAGVTTTTATSTDTFVLADSRKPAANQEGKWGVNASASIFSPMSTQYQNRGGGSDLLNMFSQQEPRTGDTAPNPPEVDMMNYRINSTDALFDNVEQGSTNNFFMGSNRTESVASHGNMWGESTGVPATGNDDMVDTFDFLVKTLFWAKSGVDVTIQFKKFDVKNALRIVKYVVPSLASANNFVSMLTREQLSVLRSIRPSLLYEFLQEVARVRGDKRMRRALPNECAFCKNNGENEECYSSHALKDWRGRVECPVLRAFRCPRCGATGDRAHTIKYCPINGEAGSERGLHGSRRGMWTGNNLNLNINSRVRAGQPLPSPSTPVSSPAPATASLTNSAIWSSFGIN